MSGSALAQTDWSVSEQQKSAPCNGASGGYIHNCTITVHNDGPGSVIVKVTKQDGTFTQTEVKSGKDSPQISIPVNGHADIVRNGADASGTWQQVVAS